MLGGLSHALQSRMCSTASRSRRLLGGVRDGQANLFDRALPRRGVCRLTEPEPPLHESRRTRAVRMLDYLIAFLAEGRNCVRATTEGWKALTEQDSYPLTARGIGL
jgi:hypothetical protein